jgi:hypothetical protein
MDDDKLLEIEAAKIIFSTPAKPEQDQVVLAAPQGPEIPFVCPFCNETYQVSEELAGKKINCRNCREACRVDAIKKLAPPIPLSHAFFFWLGVCVGIAMSVLVVLLLKISRLL